MTVLVATRPLPVLLLSACLLIASVRRTTAESITLPWCKPVSEEMEYKSRSIKEGDTVYFDWAGEAHNAYVYPSGDCLNPKDREYLGEQPGASYTFTAEDVGQRKTFVCSISNHCVAGQILSFDVVGADDQDIEYDLSAPCPRTEGYLGDTDPTIAEPATTTSAAGTTNNLVAHRLPPIVFLLVGASMGAGAIVLLV